MRTRFATSLALAAALVLAVSCATTGPDSGEGGREAVVESGVAIALFDFEVRSSSPGYEAMAADVPSALSEAFLEGGVVRPIERAALDRILGELELSMSGLVDPATAARAGKLAGARYALLGSVSVVGAQVRLSCRLIDVETAEIVYAGSAYGDVEDIFDVEDELAGLVVEDFSR